MRRFLRNYPDGGSPSLALDPRSLSWLVLHDVRSINQGNITAVNSWANEGTAGGNATPPFGNPPFYFSSASPTGRGVVQFIGSKQLHGALSAIPYSTSDGLSIVAYAYEDVVDANDGGGFNLQSLFGCYTGTDFRLYSVMYPSANTPQVGGRTLSTGDTASGTTAITGGHSFAMTLTPPSGATAGGSVRFYRDGLDIGGGVNWISSPRDNYNVSGNGVGNLCFKGSICWVGLALTRLSPGIVKALHAFSHSYWG